MSSKYRAGQFAPPNGGIIESRVNLNILGYFAGTPTASIGAYEIGAIAVDITNGLWYRNTGTTSSATWTVQYGAAVDLSSLTATATDINKITDTNATFSTTAGTGITGGVGTVIKYTVIKFGSLIYSNIYIDLTGLQAIATDGDVIGDSTNPAYLCQITAAKNGTVDMGRVTCLELPAGASTDINICTAIENTLKKDDAISGGTGVQTLVDAGGAWANGTVKGMLSTPVTANNYLYLTNGAGANAGTYSAGKFLIEFFGF